MIRKRLGRKDNHFVSPARLDRQKKLFKRLILLLAVYLVGAAVGSVAAGLVDATEPRLFDAVYNEITAVYGRSFASAVLCFAGPAAASVGMMALGGISAAGTPVGTLVLGLSGACYGFLSGTIVRALGMSGFWAAVCVLTLPGCLSALVLAALAGEAIKTSRDVLGAIRGDAGTRVALDRLVGGSIASAAALLMLCFLNVAIGRLFFS